MSARGWRWLLLGAGAYLVFLLVQLPAAYAVRWLQPRLPQLALSGVSGSLWAGQAAAVSLEGRPLGSLSWRFDWLAPLEFSLGYRLRLEDSGRSRAQGRLALGWGKTITLRAVQGWLPVAEFAPLLPFPAQGMGGELHLQIRKAALRAGRPQAAEGSVTLSDLRIQWPLAATLGDYRLVLRTAAGEIHGTLSDAGNGPIALRARFSLDGRGRYRAEGTMTARAAAPQTLRDWLSALGPADSRGAHHWQLSGSLYR